MWKHAIAIVFFVELSACGGSSTSPSGSPRTTSASAPPLTGTWAGTINEPDVGANKQLLSTFPANVRATISQSGSSLTGTWTHDAESANGTLIGSIDGSSVSMTFSSLEFFSNPLCLFTVAATLETSGTLLTGTTSFGCRGIAFSDDLRLTKQ
jgi:hypothetical protein